jgi:hypothetical protein
VLTEILEPELVEVGHVVIHFAGEFISESDEFEDLTADHASLERALPEHEPEEFVGLVVVFVLRAGAADVSEGGIGGEYDEGVVDGAEVGQLGVFQVVIGLEVEGVVAVEGLPFVGDLVEGFGCEVGLH